MSKVVIAMIAMFALMIFPGAGLVVGCTVLILEEIRSLKDEIDRISNK